MDRDRTAIVKIISHMLDNPGPSEIYPTSTCYAALERYIEGIRAEAIGWIHAENCSTLDRGEDPRFTEIPDLFERAKRDLSK